VYPALRVPSEVGGTVKMCRVRTISRKGPEPSRVRTVYRFDGVLNGVESAGNPQRLYAKPILQTEDGMI
jgi:hypothetical protein